MPNTIIVYNVDVKSSSDPIFTNCTAIGHSVGFEPRKLVVDKQMHNIL